MPLPPPTKEGRGKGSPAVNTGLFYKTRMREIKISTIGEDGE